MEDKSDHERQALASSSRVDKRCGARVHGEGGGVERGKKAAETEKEEGGTS